MQKQSFLFSWDSKWPPCDKGLLSCNGPMVARRDCDVDTHQLWHSSSGVEIKFEYVSGHLPANFFTEEIEIKVHMTRKISHSKNTLI